jgi:alpha-1,2-mannosyltransferase
VTADVRDAAADRQAAGAHRSHDRLGDRARAARAARAPLLTAVGVWAIALVLVAVLAWYARAVLPYMGDLRVYRSAGVSVLAGHRLYPPVPAWQVPQLGRSVLVFTYPPVAALLATPLALLPWHAAELAWIPVVYLPLALVVWMSFAPLLRRAARWKPAIFGALFACCACLCPMTQDIRFGQVDILLAALCLADVAAARPRWPRGLLIGLAAAVKLTPGVFIVYLLLTGRRRAAAVSAAVMAGATALSWLALPRDFPAFWTSAVLHPDRLGPNASLSNQSVRAMLLRLFAPATPPMALWLGLALAIGCLGLLAARAASRRGDEIAGVAITGLVAVLISPVSWIHHMVWVIVAIGAIIGVGRGRQRWYVGVGIAALFVIPIPNRAWEPLFERYAPMTLQTIVQDFFGIAAAVVIVILAMLPAPVRGTEPVPPPPPAVVPAARAAVLAAADSGEPTASPAPRLEPKARTGQR